MLAPTGRLAAWKSRTRSSAATGFTTRRAARLALHLDAHRDLDEYVRKNSDTRAVGAFVTHRRCGAKFRIMFTG
jgi:hypothetical protein